MSVRPLVLGIASLLCLVGLAWPQEVAGPRPLIWGADAEGGAPYILLAPNGKHIGFEVELIEALSKELRRPIVFKQVAFDSLVPHLERGDIDIAMNGLEITADRRARVDFSRPYYVYRQQLVARADEQRFASYDDLKKLKGLTVGTLEGTAAQRILERDGFKVKAYPDSVGPYRDLELKRIDAVMQDWPISLYLVQKQDEFKDKLKFVGPAIEPGFYAIAVLPKNTELASQIDMALVKLSENGTLRAILTKWELWNDDQKEIGNPAFMSDVGSSGAWDFSRYFPFLLEGAGFTILIAVLSMLLAVLVGLPVALLRLYGPAPLRALAVVYVEFFRGIPALLFLFFFYFGVLPQITAALEPLGLRWPPWLDPLVAAIVCLGLNYAAYEAEIYRAGIDAIPDGQWEAAASLGMPKGLAFRRVILPQALRTILPPMTSDFIALFKETSIVSIIGISELVKQYYMASKASLKFTEIGLVTAALYLIMSVPLGYLSRYLEARWSDEDE